jgi:hypothetical protein
MRSTWAVAATLDPVSEPVLRTCFVRCHCYVRVPPDSEIAIYAPEEESYRQETGGQAGNRPHGLEGHPAVSEGGE